MKSVITYHRYGSSIDYIPYIVYYIPLTYLFYRWKFVPLNPLIQNIFSFSLHTLHVIGGMGSYRL